VAVAAFLMVGTITGILMALMMNNAAAPGTTPRNSSRRAPLAARDPSAQGDCGRRHGGRSLQGHRRAFVHVLIKLLSTITLVAAPLFI